MGDAPDIPEGAVAPGTVYLIHFDEPYKHARHYTGWTADLGKRLDDHRAGRGARLMEVIKNADISWRLARTWTGGRDLERAIKDLHEAPRLCPECSPQPLPLNTGRSVGHRSRARATSPAPPGREPSPAAEVVPSPVPGAELPPVFPGRPASREIYRDLWQVTDDLITGWRAGPPAGAGVPEPAPGRDPAGTTTARAIAEAEPELEAGL
jgi:predicted GIY-YIG superfamily endonuclease